MTVASGSSIFAQRAGKEQTSKMLPSLLPFFIILILGIVLYVPFASKMLYHSDSIGFALSIHHFDLNARQPHAPGQPLYVMTVRAVNYLTGASDNNSLVTVSIAATILSVILFYLLSKTWFSSSIALLLSITLLTSPIVWFNAEIAMRYPMVLLSAVAVALACRKVVQGSPVAAYAAPFTWGLAAGFSHEVTVALGPLLIFCCYLRRGKSQWYLPLAFALAVLAIALWLLPLTQAAGGVVSYYRTVRVQTSAYNVLPFLFRDFPFAFELILKNAIVVFLFLSLGSIGLLPLLLTKLRSFQLDCMSKFLLIWLAPGVLLHCITTIGHSGYVLNYLPAVLLLLSGAALLPIGAAQASVSGRSNLLLLAIGIGLQSSYFLFAPQSYWSTSGNWMMDTLLRSEIVAPTRSRIAEYDSTLKSLITEINHRFPASETMLIVAVSDETPRVGGVRPFFAQGKYYLPSYEQRVLYTSDQVPMFKKFSMKGSIVAEVSSQDFRLLQTNIVNIPAAIRWLVWFCDTRRQPYQFGESWLRQPLPSGSSLVYAELSGVPGETLRWGSFEFRH
jgi:hypothetical protein